MNDGHEKEMDEENDYAHLTKYDKSEIEVLLRFFHSPSWQKDSN